MKQEDEILHVESKYVEPSPMTTVCHMEHTEGFVAEPQGQGRRRVSALEKRLLRKSDAVIIPLAALSYFVNYLDRNSIGNARVMGFQSDLFLSNIQFYNCLTMYFVGYIILLLPANLLIRRLNPSRTIGSSIIFFGAVLCGMSAVKNYATVMVLRLLLGAGGAFTGSLTLYTSLYYKRDELATRNSVYYSAASISGAFGGVLAYGVQTNLTHAATGRSPWQWPFIIKGAVSIFAGIAVVVFLPRYPDDLQKRGSKHWLFAAEEIDLAAQRCASYNTNGAGIQYPQLWATVKDPKTYLFAVCQMASVLGVGVIGNFLPTLIKGFGFSPLRTQLFTIIPYTCGFFSVLFSGIMSDRLNTKGPFLFSGYALACVGFVLLISTTNTIARIIATCLVTSGAYGCIILLPVWIAINTGGYTKRSATWGFAEACGLSFSIMGTGIYTDPPRFIKGHSIVLGVEAAAAISAVINYFWMRSQNRKKDAIEREYRERNEVHPDIASKSSLEDLQDQHISFRYIL